MRRIIPLVLGAVLCSGGAGCGAEADAMAGGEQAGTSGELRLEEGLEMEIEGFSLSLAVEGDLLHVGLTAPTTGWVAVGFDPSAAMKDANIVIGYVSGDQVFVRDDWGIGHTSHVPDEEVNGTDDIADVSGAESGGSTSLAFTIPLDSGTPGDKALVPGSAYDILLAYGPDDADNFEGFHRWAKVVEVEF